MPCRRRRRDLALARRVRDLEADVAHLREALVDSIAQNAVLTAELLEANRG